MAQRWNAVLARLGSPTGDGRMLLPGGISNRDLPMPLMWQEKTSDGHSGAVTVGVIDEVTYSDDTVFGSGYLLDLSPYRDRLIELISARVVGPSIDLSDDVEYYLDDESTIVVTSAMFGGATLVPIEAFSDVSIHLSAPDTMEATEPEYLMASASTNLPPLDLFKNPHLDGPTGITVNQAGEFQHVFGHVAAWNVCHVGLPGCTTAPASQTDYAYFMVGAEKTSEGVDVPVGKLTVGGGHANGQAGYQAAAAHYDDVATAVASVFAGEDIHGIWVSGYILPGVSEEKVAELLRSPLSGDWRRIGGNLEMIAAHAVNVPGFPVPRAKVKFSAGVQHSLIASASIPEQEAKEEDHGGAARAAWAKSMWKGR